MDILHKYDNGNITVTIYEDGTKIQEWEGEHVDAKPRFPNSMDVKITNYCDLGCKFCHEMSTVAGKHGDIDYLLSILKDLPRGTELAIGGGNPLDHPEIERFLNECSKLNLICNMTVNHKHIIGNLNKINKFLDERLIYGLGISIDDTSNLNILKSINKTSNIVFHVIAGVNDISVLNKINNSLAKKVLILGYKLFGRGKQYYSPEVKANLINWYKNLPKYVGKVHLSFDNLAINQLNVSRFFSEKAWDNFYMGTDGQFTMYIDAVKKQYAVSSTSHQKFTMSENIETMFASVRHMSNFT